MMRLIFLRLGGLTGDDSRALSLASRFGPLALRTVDSYHTTTLEECTDTIEGVNTLVVDVVEDAFFFKLFFVECKKF